ncbi:MAG: SIR2 family NAD-dependent protein deacylase [Alphaproteobacteria bacterium]
MSGRAALEAALAGVARGRLVPYLGPGVTALGSSGVPASPGALATLLEAHVRPPRRARGNLWAVAQYIETRRFRRTAASLVERAFAPAADDNPLHRWLAAIRPPLVVDAWYDGGLIDAYAAASAAGWGRVQAVSRHDVKGEAFTRAFDAAGAAVGDAPDPAWTALIYQPHGLARTGSSLLLSDSDYVPVLTEIDIQTPIPAEVQARRRGRGFLFIGCRFDDQMLRIFARQTIKRSGGPHLAVIDGPLTRMEARFLAAEGIARVDLDLAAVVAALPPPA